MDVYGIITILVVLSAIFGYINIRFMDMPNSIGLMVITLVFTLVVLGIGTFDNGILETQRIL